VIPTLIYVGVCAGILTGRSWVLTLLAIPGLGMAWGLSIVGLDGDVSALPGGFVLGTANAVFGVLFGACVRGLVESFRGREVGR
jgi:hypothetical protein